MTNEEKAEVYLNGDMSLDTEEKYFAYTKGYCKGHTDGLAEGRKEKYEMALSQIRHDREKVIEYNEQLEKENAELKQQTESDQLALNESKEIIAELKYKLKCRDDELAESKAEIKQIIERERVVPEHYLCEMIDKNKELKAQIEKMKCCGNCKKHEVGKDCKELCFDNFEKWELKE